MALLEIASAPATPEDFASWSFAHMAHHRDIIRGVAKKYSKNLGEYPLDPFNPADNTTWLYLHQQMHNNQNQVLSIQGQNLLSVDWKDPESVLSWVNANYTEHLEAAKILGLG